MKIALVSPTPVPPVFGGMDRLLDGLCAALRRRHPTDLVTIPVDERTPAGVLRGYFDFYHLDLSAYDLVITYKAPAYMVRHPRQVCYLSHRLRVFYDLYEPRDSEHERMRDLIRFMDDWALDKSRLPHLFTVGETVSRRLIKFGGHASTPIHHPTTFSPRPPQTGSYFLSVGRLHPWKRIDLLIKAFRLSGAACPLKVAGEGPQETELRELAVGDERIEFLGKVSDAELAALYSRALVTVFPPISEDMGLITFESFLSGKPVLTTNDSGEPALIVEEGKTGFVTEPTPEALAERMDWIWQHAAEVERMSEACLARVAEVTWDRLVDRLLEASEALRAPISSPPPDAPSPTSSSNGRAPSGPPKIRLLVCDNQILDPPVGGGRIRIHELYRHLPEDFEVTYLGAFDYPGPAPREQMLGPAFREILTPLTVPHFKAHHLLARLSGGSATIDVTMPVVGRLTPRYARQVRSRLDATDILIVSHPWMTPFLPDPLPVPLVYDSHNCEALVKQPLLGASIAGRYLASRVRRVERETVTRSQLVLACSTDDAHSFVDLYGAERRRILLAPNGVDCAAIHPVDESTRRENRTKLGVTDELLAVFTGSNYPPNLEAATFMIEELAPRFPKAVFALAGGVGPMYREIYPSRPIPANVLILGIIERSALIELYGAADLALNPMQQGSGTNIKMLDYMAAGLPILTTGKGARGLAGRSGEHWIEVGWADMPREFEALSASAEFRCKLGCAARDLAEKQYDWRTISSRLAEVLREVKSESDRAKLPL